MFKAVRITLIVSVLLSAYVVALALYLVPYAWLVAIAVVVGMACKKTYRYTAFGTARWAAPEDIPQLLEGSGLSVGQIEGKPGKVAGVKALFNSWIADRPACERFLQSFQKNPPKQLVRL